MVTIQFRTQETDELKYLYCASMNNVSPLFLNSGIPLTFWRRNYFFLILAHPVYKM